MIQEKKRNKARRLLAHSLEVSERTLRNWKRGAREPVKPIGRPAVSKNTRYQALLKVRRELKRQGWKAGWRPIYQAVYPWISMRLTQESLVIWKAWHAARQENRLRKNRMKVEVLGSDVIWVEDSTHLGRVGKKGLMGEVVKDRGTLANLAVAVGEPVRGQDVVEILEVKKDEGRLPLVWATDNGPAYKSSEVSAFCGREKMIHLFSRPHTPQDNASAERGIGELKAESGLGKGVVLPAEQEVVSRLTQALHLLERRPRASKGYQTAVQLENSLLKGPQMVDRDRFYTEACRNVEKAIQGGGTKRQRRQNERMAIYRTLEKFQLIRVTRGGKLTLLNKENSEDIL